MSGFCCFSMTNPNPLDAGQSECPYFGIAGFANLYPSKDGKEYCKLHLPISNDPINGQLRAIDQGELFHHILQVSRRKQGRVIDLRKTYWRTNFNCHELDRQIGANSIERIDLTEAEFATSLTWNSPVQVQHVIFDSVKLREESTFISAPASMSFKGAFFYDDHTNTDATSKMDYSKSVFYRGFIFDSSRHPTSLILDDAKFMGSAHIKVSNQNTQTISLLRSISDQTIKIENSHSSRPKVYLTSSKFGDALLIDGCYGVLNIDEVHCKKLNLLIDVQSEFSGQSIECLQRAYIGGGFAPSTNFSKSRFEGETIFSDAQFFSDVAFSSVTFSGLANFRNTTFSGNADFSNSIFSNEATWETSDKAKTFKALTLDKVTFKSFVRFTNRKFAGPLSCRETTFSLAPDFHGCEFHQDTNFKGAKFFDVTRDEAGAAYRTLKLAMEGLRAKDEEALFYALEQRSWRKNAKGVPFTRTVSLLYDLGSDYGRSIGKPLGFFAASLFIFSSIYLLNYTNFSGCLPPTTDILVQIENAIRYQFTQLVRPFDAVALRSSDTPATARCTVPFWLAGVSAIQTLLQLSLIALLFLAIRRRFKME